MADAGDHRQRGSVLMLMPVAVLIVIVLGAIAIDRAVIFGAQRELVQSAQAAANDAAAIGVDVEALRADGAAPSFDPDRIERVVAASLVGVEDLIERRWYIDGDEIVVVLEQRVDLVFTKAVPGAEETAVVTATARASLRAS